MTGESPPVLSADPRTGHIRTLDVRESTASDVDAVASAARRVCAWLADLQPSELTDLLHRLGDSLENRRQELVAAADAETALGASRLNSELTRAILQFRLFAEAASDGSLFGVTIDHARDDQALPQPDLRKMNVAIGAVAVFAASNFPFAFSVPGTDTASALAARCAVVVKAHPAHPATSIAAHAVLSEAANAAGAPPGLIGLVLGMEAGRQLATHDAISAIAFTGSRTGGMALQQLASQRPRPIPFYGELGSMNPVIATAGALEERGRQIATGFLESAMLGQGQFCTKPGLLLVQDCVHAETLLADLRTAVASWPGGFLLSEHIRDAYEANVKLLERLSGIEIVRSQQTAEESGWYARPTVVIASLSALARYPELTAECFGPLTVVATYQNSADLHDTLGTLEPALAASIHVGSSDDPAMLRTLLDLVSMQSGRIVFNGYSTGVAVCDAQHHGGPWPASTDSLHTSVGLAATKRFLRPVAFQDCPDQLLPEPLRDTNTWGVPQRVGSRPADAPEHQRRADAATAPSHRVPIGPV